MNRWRVLSIVIIFFLMGFSACVLAFHNPTPAPFPDDNFIHTSVYGTLTALAEPSLTFTPLGSATLPPLLPPNATPHDFIYYYFNNINIRNYNLTWSLLTDRFKARLNGTSQGDYTGYITFWNSVQQVTVLNAFYVCDGDICAVNTSLTLQYLDGTADTSAYNYTVIFDHSLNSWMFDFIPAPTATASRTFTLTRTYTRTVTFTVTRTGTSTSTFTATLTRTRTTTPTVTNTATYTLTRTGTSTATPTFSPTQTVSATASQTPTASSTPTITPTSTITYTPSETPTSTDTSTPTETPTLAGTETETSTPTPTETPVP